MITFLLTLLAIVGGFLLGQLKSWLDSEAPDASDAFDDLTSSAQETQFDIAADVRRAEQRIRRLTQPRTSRRSVR